MTPTINLTSGIVYLAPGGLANAGNGAVPTGVATGQVLVSNGVGNQGVWSASPVLSGSVTATKYGFAGVSNFFGLSGTATCVADSNGSNNLEVTPNGVLVNGVPLTFGTGGTPDSGLSRLGAASFSMGTNGAGDFTGSLKLTTLNIASGGSTTISTGVGSVKMSTANSATNTSWIPITYAGTAYFVPAFTTNAP